MKNWRKIFFRREEDRCITIVVLISVVGITNIMLADVLGIFNPSSQILTIALLTGIAFQSYFCCKGWKALDRRTKFRRKFLARVDSLVFEMNNNKAFTPRMLYERAEQYREVLRLQVKGGILK